MPSAPLRRGKVPQKIYWEGNILNKISKKIVALATMAAFVLTLVPMAAFGAQTPQSAVDPSKSTVQTEVKNVAVNIGDKVEFSADLDLAGVQEVYFWVEDAEGNVVNDVDYYAQPSDYPNDATDSIVWIGNNKVFYTERTTTGLVRALDINVSGEFVIKAGVNKQVAGTVVDAMSDLSELQNLKDYTNIKVSVPEVKTLTLSGENSQGTLASINEDPAGSKVYKLDLLNDAFKANTSDTYIVSGNVKDEDNRNIANLEVSVKSHDSALWFDGATEGDKTTYTTKTDENGDFSFTFRMNDNRNVPITITIDGKEYTVRVVKEQTRAYDIDVVEDGGYVLAGDSEHWTEWSGLVGNGQATLKDAVTFSVKDINGNPVGEEDMAGEPAMTGYADSTPAHSQYVDILVQPDDSDLNENNLYLYEVGDGIYSLEYKYGTKEDRIEDLTPGKYEVSVSILGGDSAIVTFYVADFGTVEDTVLSMVATDRSTLASPGEVRTVDLTDEVTLGQDVEVTAQYVDGNGIKIDAGNDVRIGAMGKALIDNKSGLGTVEFMTRDDEMFNESLLGTVVHVNAFNAKNGQWVEQDLTVVDSYNAFDLEFDPTEGPINEENDVDVTVVKEDGTTAQVNGTIVGAYVADQSNEDAKVYVGVKDNGVTKGKGEIVVYASQPTTAEIVVAVEDDTNDGLYAATLEYNFGNVDVTAHHEVTMTIGSSKYVVDKQLFTMDAAPYVDSNWRTMVPIRALAEAFDATVTYDNDDRTVTIEYNDQTIVMTIDDATYSVNGEEAEMDTEAVINSADDRTYVPVRFAAEAMGFKVTALYDENSSTASVVFQS